MAITLGNLGDALAAQRERLPEALAMFERAATIFEAQYGEQHPHALHMRRRLAECREQQAGVGAGEPQPAEGVAEVS